jgi:hypothetical protein
MGGQKNLTTEGTEVVNLEHTLRQSPAISPTVSEAVARLFSPDQIPKAEQLLLDYGTEEHEGGVERIRLDILTLCGGDMTKLGIGRTGKS